MQKYRKYLALLFLTAAAATVTGCGISEKEASIMSGAQTAHMQTDEEPANIVLINNIYYYDTGRTVFSIPDHTNGTIHSVTASQNTRPHKNEEANFDCQGAAYCILADGAAAVMTDEASGTYELFLADDTVEFQGVCKKKKEISSDTLKWLNFYYSLSESDRNALSMIPSEFAGQISGNSMRRVPPTLLIWKLLPRRNLTPQKHWHNITLPRRLPPLRVSTRFTPQILQIHSTITAVSKMITVPATSLSTGF